MTTDQIERLRELLAKGTAKPWQSHQSHIYGPDPDRDVVTQAFSLCGHICDDRDLIVAAINVLPDLLDTIERLREQANKQQKLR